MGPRDRPKARICPQRLQVVSPVSPRTRGTGRFPRQKPEERLYPGIQVSNGFTLLLCRKEGWITPTMSRLPIPERMDHQEQVPPTPCLGVSG